MWGVGLRVLRHARVIRRRQTYDDVGRLSSVHLVDRGALRSSLSYVNVSGGLEIEDGSGGILVYQRSLYGHGDAAQWLCGVGHLAAAGLYLAQFAGDQMLVHCSLAGGRPALSVSSYHNAANLTGNAGVGKLSVIATSDGTQEGGLRATMMGTGGDFTVRRVAM